MHPKYQRANDWSRKAIGAAVEVHRHKGPGLIESIYQKCLMRELSLQGIPALQQLVVSIEYKGLVFDEPLKLDVYVDDCLLLELKAVEKVLPIHKAQLFSYMKLLGAPLGLLINFHETRLIDGIHRLILPGADGERRRFETEGSKGSEGPEENRARPSFQEEPGVYTTLTEGNRERIETEGSEGSKGPEANRAGTSAREEPRAYTTLTEGDDERLDMDRNEEGKAS